MTLPSGWLYDDGGDSGVACIDAKNLDNCSVLLVAPAQAGRAGTEIDGPDADSDFGWYLGTDVPGCANYRRDGLQPDAADAALLDSRGVERGFRPLGSKTAVFRAFALTCEGRQIGTARLWLLPTSMLAVVALDTSGTTPPAEVDRLVALLDTEDFRA